MTSDAEKLQALVCLKSVIDLINPTVGDAISDMLAVEGILSYMEYSLEKWDQLYDELPNRQIKIKVTS